MTAYQLGAGGIVLGALCIFWALWQTDPVIGRRR